MLRPSTRFGLVLRSVRESHQLTQEQLSQLSSIPQETISRLETGKTTQPTLDTLLALCRALNFPVEKLLKAL
jgi:transcriptional regulator with XRE-family HTH domain